MSDVKVTPTEVDAIAAADLIEAYWHDSDASMMKLAASYRAGHRQGVFIRAMTAARLQGWSEGREAAAKVADDEAEGARILHNKAAADRDKDGIAIHGEAWRTGKHIGALTRGITPSTPETSHVE